MTDGITPVSAIAAVRRMSKYVDVMMPYRWGSGSYEKGSLDTGSDHPWTPDKIGIIGSDCAGAVCYAYALVRHREGFNVRKYDRFDILDVENDINTNSLIGDALHDQALFVALKQGELLQPGDVLAYPTIRLPNKKRTDWLRNDENEILAWPGHAQLVEFGNGARAGGPYTEARVMQCYGPNNRRPAIRRTDAHAMDRHDETWPKTEHRTQALRLHPRFVRS